MFDETLEAGEALRTHQPCPDCGSHDALSVYADHTYCFSCQTRRPLGDGEADRQDKPRVPKGLLAGVTMQDIHARKLTEATCRKYGYGVAEYRGETVQVAPYYGRRGELLFQKLRTRNKEFRVLGESAPVFFGQHLFTGGRKLVVTEGEIDCLTVSQVQGNKYPVVSIPNGVSSAAACFKKNLAWLLNFEEVIVMFDMDEPGREAVAKVGGLLPPHRLKVASLPYKDANECLMQGEPDVIVKAIWQAEEYRPDGVVNAKELEDALFSKEADVVSYPFPWGDNLTRMTQGIRKGEMLLLTAGSGIGKSTAAREIAYHLKMKHGLKIGLVMLEENPKKTVRDLLSIHMERPLHLSWTDKTKAEAKARYGEVFGDGGFVLYDHFGSIEGAALMEKIRYLIVAEACDFVIFDHISIAVAALDDRGADERKAIDRLMTELRSLVEETGAGLIIVSHLRKTDTKSVPFESGGAIGMDDLRGSGSLKQLPDTIIALERNQQADDESLKNTLKLRVLKCRFTGATGVADYVTFNKAKNRIEDADALETDAKKEEETSCPF